MYINVVIYVYIHLCTHNIDITTNNLEATHDHNIIFDNMVIIKQK